MANHQTGLGAATPSRDSAPLSRPAEVLVLGAGARGEGYAELIAGRPDLGRIVGVAEPDPGRRDRFAKRHGLGAEAVFSTWQEALDQPRLADLAFVTTQDSDHVDVTIACARARYDILLEKPVAPTERETREVVEAVEECGVIFGVCHVLRYTPHTLALKAVLDQGVIGQLMSVQHLEPVGWWHAAHSFVRGNWRREDQSSPMLLAKSCHDLDWLLYIIGKPCRRVSSFGSLGHFKRSHQPAGAAERCLDCPSQIENTCPYSAPRLYLEGVRQGRGWPVSVVTSDTTEAGVLKALREGPYGRCVYTCDNDVVDHQVVQMEFDEGVTASFTMSAFTTNRGRETKLFGTHGEITTDSRTITIDDFRTGTRRSIDTQITGGGIRESGHGGGDEGLVLAMLNAVQQRRQDLITSSARQTLESHRLVFAAERSRRQGTVERL